MAKNRDDFSYKVVQVLAKRAGYHCSNPKCRCSTTAPSKSESEKSIYIGKAAHITAAAPGGARYDPTLTPEQRSSIDNAIFLCSNCADIIDKNQGVDHPKEVLFKWKRRHEAWVKKSLGNPNTFKEKHHKARSSNEKLRQLLSTYSSAFLQVYNTSPNKLVPFFCVRAGETISSIDAADNISRGESFLLTGPSGCGKSLLAKQIAQQCITHSKIPIFIEAKYFDGDIWDLLNKEVSLLGIPSAEYLLDACANSKRLLLVILDGYNECIGTERDKLARSLLALTQAKAVTILVTSQQKFESLKILNLKEVTVLEPNIEIKTAVATASMGAEIPLSLQPLLMTIRSGLEASLVGEVGQEITDDKSLFALFDTYVRKRLKLSALEGIRLLSIISKFLSDRVTFSLSVRELERLLEGNIISAQVLEGLFKANLLIRYGDRISFSHELFLNAFVAEAVIRYSGNDPDKVLALLALPKHSERKALIVGAIDDLVVLNKVLEGITDHQLIVFCTVGNCGSYARQWAEKQCELVLNLIKEETRSIRFKIGEKGWFGVYVEPEASYKWSKRNQTVIAALPQLFLQGKYLKDIFEILELMDESLNAAFRNLIDEARQKKFPLRDSLFGNVYMSNTTAIAQIRQSLYLDFNKYKIQNKSLVSFINDKFVTPNLSNGQLYFILTCCDSTLKTEVIFSVLPNLLNTRWPYIPYHLRIRLIEIAGQCCEVSEPDKQILIQSLKSLLNNEQNLFINSTAVESLQRLGGLTDDETEHEIFLKEEINCILANPDEPNNWPSAYNIYSNRFMHAFADTYNKVFSELLISQRKSLLAMALRGIEQPDLNLFISCIITELADFGDTTYGKYIEPWASVPSKDSQNTNADVDIFVTANIVLGQLAYHLPSQLNNSDSATTNALQACGEILYWCNRIDIAFSERKERCEQAWGVLMQHEPGASMDAIRLCEQSVKGLMAGLSSVAINVATNGLLISRVFQEQVMEVCRISLCHPTIQQSHFQTRFHFSEQAKLDILAFAIDQVGKHGLITDLTLLRNFVDDTYLGANAINAIKCLENKSAQSLPIRTQST